MDFTQAEAVEVHILVLVEQEAQVAEVLVVMPPLKEVLVLPILAEVLGEGDLMEEQLLLAAPAALASLSSRIARPLAGCCPSKAPANGLAQQV